MGNKMLIDATHPEETRVVALRGNRVEEFDYESAARKQLRGNIYLAKVTRVEPSLQAAFVDYGGNRHGFLAFSEIHPDYYQIPVAERQALLEEQAEGRARRAARAAAGAPFAGGPGEETEEAPEEAGEPGGPSGADGHYAESLAAEGLGGRHERHEEGEPFSASGIGPDGSAKDHDEIETVGGAVPPLHDETPEAGEGETCGGVPVEVVALEAILPPRLSEELSAAIARAAEAADEIPLEGEQGEDEGEIRALQAPEAGAGDLGEGAGFESVGSEDALEELPQRSRLRRRYKIQEVIRRRQILLVQVVKEERGNKGAALTTYLSLAGRYTVLMPNTDTGGGISRKITQPVDRKRLKEIANELEVPEGMGLIIRTAGAARTKAEIKRDFEYLLRLWENVRDLTLKSTAPALVYEEGNIIKRAIRDLYNKDIDEIAVAGEDAYREAKDFMRMLMPSHARNVQPYREPEPIFIRYEVERQLNAMFSPYVTLRSGGYIVINQTEALVAIDVNSGKATREHSIEDTALRTNSEAAEEIARQLRLRDLAGLIVIDFIDMEEKRNNRAVERRLKDCLRNDRARIQVGHISHFGLLEMSRQRLRTGVLEGSTSQCQMCQGTGVVRSTESVALWVLRTIEDTLRTEGPNHLSATTSVEVALYILNHKRSYLRDIESRYGVSLTVSASERMHGANFAIEKAAGPIIEAPAARAVHMDWTQMDEEEGPAAESEGEIRVEAEEQEEQEQEQEQEEEVSAERVSRRRRSRRRRGREDREIRHVAHGRHERHPSQERIETLPDEACVGEEGGEGAGATALANGAASEDGAGVSGAPIRIAAERSGAVVEIRDDQRADEDEDGEERPKRSRRRGRRGGRRQRSLRQMHETAAVGADGLGEEQSLEGLVEQAGERSVEGAGAGPAAAASGGEAGAAVEAPAGVAAPQAVQAEAAAPVGEPGAGDASVPAASSGAGEASVFLPESAPRLEGDAVVTSAPVNGAAPELPLAQGPEAVAAGDQIAGEAGQKPVLAVVEMAAPAGSPGEGGGAAETQEPASPAFSPEPAAVSRVAALRRRRKGWWQRRLNG